jgi:hypothetical protein
MCSFRSSLDAFPTPCYKPVEFPGTNRPGSADSEGGVGIYFSYLTKQCEEVLKQQGHTAYGYVPLARTGLLCQLASAAPAHEAEPAAADAAIAAAAAAAAAEVPGAAAAGTRIAAPMAEPAVHSRRCSSSGGGDAWRGKPDLILACIPEPSIQQHHSSSGVANMQRLQQQRVVAFGELKVRETLTNNGVPVDLALLYEEGDIKARAVLGQAYSYMVQLQVRSWQ